MEHNSDDVIITHDSNLKSSKRICEATSAATFLCIISDRLFTGKQVHLGAGGAQTGANCEENYGMV